MFRGKSIGCLVLLALLCTAAQAPAQELPRVLIQRGERFLAMGKLDAAIANYSRVIACCEGTPEAAEAHNDIGVAFMRKGDRSRAMSEYRKALAEDDYPLARFNLAKALVAEADECSATERRKTLRDEARKEFLSFSDWLRGDAHKPAVVTYQQAEIEAYVEGELKKLQP